MRSPVPLVLGPISRNAVAYLAYLLGLERERLVVGVTRAWRGTEEELAELRELGLIEWRPLEGLPGVSTLELSNVGRSRILELLGMEDRPHG